MPALEEEIYIGDDEDVYVPPAITSGDWARIADLAAGRTEYRSVNIAVQANATFDFSGTYSVTSVTTSQITLGTPEVVNSAWTGLTGETAYISPTLSTQGEAWVGPFVVDQDCDAIICNVTAPQGLYYVTEKGKDRPWYVDILFEVRPVNAAGAPTGAGFTQTHRISGDGKDKSPRGSTVEIPLPSVGRYRVRARRTTPADSPAVRAALGIKIKDEGTIVEEIKWRDCFGVVEVTTPDFGNITTVMTRTYATSQASSQKDRKLNCVVTRKVLARNLDNTLGPTLVATTNAASIICHMALDPVIGGRTLAELDVPQLFDTISEVESYFGISDVSAFGYAFDQDNISFEEMVQTVAQAAFCTAYRQGSVLRLFFERQTDDSTLLFNHRNKVPGSETRTVRFGSVNDNDGVEVEYTSPVDGTKLTIYLPEDQSAVRARKLELLGVNSEPHAMLHAYRAFNKIKYQHTTCQFDALAEASQLVLSERIEVADNTRQDVFDGYLVSQAGLVLELSQPFEPAPATTYSIFIQHEAGGVEVIACTAGADNYHVILAAPPSTALIFDENKSADIAYQIVAADAPRTDAFIVSEKGAYDRRTLGVQAINYDQRYYSNDQDYA